MIPLAGFQPATDPRVIRTVNAIERELMSDGFVQRYRPKEHIDGLPPGEGAFRRVHVLAGRTITCCEDAVPTLLRDFDGP